MYCPRNNWTDPNPFVGRVPDPRPTPSSACCQMKPATYQSYTRHAAKFRCVQLFVGHYTSLCALSTVRLMSVAVEKGAILAGRKGPAVWLRDGQMQSHRCEDTAGGFFSAGVMFRSFRLLGAVGFAFDLQDTGVKVLDPSLSFARTGRIWPYRQQIPKGTCLKPVLRPLNTCKL